VLLNVRQDFHRRQRSRSAVCAAWHSLDLYIALVWYISWSIGRHTQVDEAILFLYQGKVTHFLAYQIIETDSIPICSAYHGLRPRSISINICSRFAVLHFLHEPKSGLQPALQYSEVLPHHPYWLSRASARNCAKRSNITYLQQLPYLEPWHVVFAFPPHLASVEIFTIGEGFARSLVDDGRAWVVNDKAGTLHEPKED
jgi:hypothetical protein